MVFFSFEFPKCMFCTTFLMELDHAYECGYDTLAACGAFIGHNNKENTCKIPLPDGKRIKQAVIGHINTA